MRRNDNSEKGEGMFQDIKPEFVETVRRYPLKMRAGFASSVCVSLLLGTINWKFEPAKTIVICAFTVACLFDIRGKWFMLFTGIGVGDLMLYLWG